MDDEKRKKLREYLRNNRPKNSVNLGNSSNNEEKSNRNLEDELNLCNSNLNNSQISDNKINSNKRDYDKEPVVIKDYSDEILANGLLGVGILLLIYKFLCIYEVLRPVENRILGNNNFLFSPVAYAMIFIYFSIKFRKKDKTMIYFKNLAIEYYNKDIYSFKRKLNLIKTNIDRNNFTSFIGILFLSLIFTIFIDVHSALFIFFCFIFIMYFPYFMFYIKYYKTIKDFLSFNTIYLIENKRYFIFFPASKQEYDDLQEYFLEKLSIDIKKLPKNFLII
ncbi:hypothetical protein [Campylobacter ureolyticus]|uniref:hypothetical protein n=1 Tax=Campylobacter ureolyticus TaxID=827 RepID=UPI001FC823FB|nr:hypothetical protein [Campylobacter ureolyticus]MCZ6106236.1 hypothetical protein [Campylobacter ureolyticus]MCZ6158811.1 hypothetical protein [Campylobacter ureolyticus]GKH60364.1 hypothetical protein CE91St25_07000 [Campylobacter ureolyticus]